MPVAVPGVVYTPRALTAPMVRRALAPLPDDARVCDPALGEGAFLIEAIDYLAARSGRSKRSIAKQMTGVDVDARAVEVARAAIGDASLHVGNALTMAWRDSFDAVIGNPPYVRQEWLDDKRALAGYEVGGGVADLYVYFVELAHRLLKPDGRWCLVVPNKWMTAAYGRPLREFLSRHATLEGLVDLSRAPALFPADAFPCVMWGTKRASRAPIRAARGDVEAIDGDGIAHDRERWRGEPWHVDTPEDRARLDALARWPTLGELAGKPSRGIVTGCNRAFVIDGDTRARLADAGGAGWIRPLIRGRDIRPLATTRDRYLIVVDHGTPEDALPRAIHAHLARFRDALEPGSGRKPGTYKWYELQDPVGPLGKTRAPRMFYQDIQTQPACVLDATGEWMPDTTVWGLPSADPVILAVLNSSSYGWYAQRRFPPALNGAVRPKLAYIRGLPIPVPSAELRGRIEALLAARDRVALDAAVAEAYAGNQALARLSGDCVERPHVRDG